MAELAQPADAQLERGTAVGRYTILALVGKGGMGEVYAAYDPDLDRKVAIKLMHGSGGHDAARAQARLLREAKAMARLSHPNVVAVHDAGTYDGRVFVAMEFVDGVTLEEWLAARARTRDAILAVFAEAAAGLGAAHAAGLVHRDFTPRNVVIGRDGAARVTDFGLARPFGDADGETDGETDDDVVVPSDLHLTRTGELRGTPLYMAPEQFLGRATDARTDQFAFCVALYRAIYGAAPFGEGSLEALTTKVVQGVVDAPPPRASVPAAVRRVVLRGLSAAPDARWPSMNALVDALARDPARTGRRAALGLALVAAAALAVVVVAARRAPPLCLGGPARLADVWQTATSVAPGPRRARESVERAFRASGAPGAGDVWDRVAAVLDRYAARWLAAYADACEATNVRREQPAALFDLRMACLDERRTALAALTDQLARADRDVVAKAVDAANALPNVDGCADRRVLEARVEPPRDEHTRKAVEELRTRAAVAKALNDTGRHEEATALARAQLVEARAVGYKPLVAEMLAGLGRTVVGPNFRADILPVDEEQLWAALEVGRDDLAADAAGALAAGIGGYMGRYDEGLGWARLGHALLDRVGAGGELSRSWIVTNEGTIAFRRGRPAEALALAQQALELKEKVLPPDHPDVGISLNNKAEALAALGRTEEALRLNARVNEIYLRAYGPASTELASSLSNRGEYLTALDRPAEALDPLRRALAGWEGQLGPEHQFLAYPLTALGRALLALDRPREAVAPLDRALRVREAREPDARLVADTRFALARALAAAGAEGARARDLATKARAVYAAAPDAAAVAGVDAWLAARAAAPTRGPTRTETTPSPSLYTGRDGR
jgi:eukaryotic-like serine/threonine-protein kinase